MKRLTVITMLLLLSFLNASAADIIFAPISKDKLEMTARIYEPFVKWVSEKVSLSVKAKYYTDYADIIKGFKQGTVDLAYLGPLPILELESEYDSIEKVVTFLSDDGKPEYTCAIIAMGNASIPDIKTFKGTMALTQPLSTCGHYNAVQTLEKHGRNMDGIDYFFSGSHSGVALDVIMGKAKIGSMQTSIAKSYSFQKVRILEESAPYPGFTLVANTRTMSRRQIDTIKHALLSFDPVNNPQDISTAHTWHKNIRYGSVPVNESLFVRMKKEFMKYNRP